MSFRNMLLERVNKPEALLPVPQPQPHISPVEPGYLEGWWYLLRPRTPKEIAFVQSLELHVDKYAPARGDGVLVSSGAVEWLRKRNLSA